MEVKAYKSLSNLHTIVEITFSQDDCLTHFEQKYQKQILAVISREIKERLIKDLINDKKFRKKVYRNLYKKLNEVK